MAEFPAMPLYTDAYLADTGHLTTLEHGAYFLLLVTMWRSKDQTLPDDDKKLARIARLTKGQWARIRPCISEFFHVENGEWRQGRLTDEYTLVRQKSKRQSDKARSRWLKDRDSGDATGEPQQSPSDASHNPTHSPNSDNKLSESNSPPKAKKSGAKKHEYTSDFELFWQAYGPNGASKLDSFKKWQRAITESPPDEIIAGVQPYLDYCRRSNTPKCHATSWLNQYRWTINHDELGHDSNDGRPQSAHDTFGQAWAGAVGGDPR